MEEARWKNWDMENGYHYKSENAPSLPHNSSEEMPRRALAPGLHMGLSVMINVKEDEYYCSGTESVGFKVRRLSERKHCTFDIQNGELG